MIITHMNSSHQDSLSLFLQHYCAVPAFTASSAALTAVNLDSLIITSQGKRYYVPLKPALQDYAEMRTRLVAMHKDCLQALALSDIKITRYTPPQGFMQRFNFLIVVATMLSFSRQEHFVPGSWFYSTFGLEHVPSFTWFCRTIQPWLIVGMMVIHLGEAVWMARTRLRRHGVRRWSGLWWRWMGTCFIEGAGSYWRLDGMVEREKREVEKKH
jgi:Protein of unknown function (DUF2470)